MGAWGIAVDSMRGACALVHETSSYAAKTFRSRPREICTDAAGNVRGYTDGHARDVRQNALDWRERDLDWSDKISVWWYTSFCLRGVLVVGVQARELRVGKTELG